MRLASLVPAAVIGVAFAAAPAAHAQTFFSAFLNGAQENPPVVTPGTGFGTVRIVSPTSISVSLNVTNLTSNITIGHIHLASGGVNTNGGVVVDLLDSSVFTPNATIGGPGFNFLNFSNRLYTVPTSITSGANSLQDANRVYYFNIHTVNNGPGEVRGNIVASPEPGTFALLAAGGLLAGGAAFRAPRRNNSAE